MNKNANLFSRTDFLNTSECRNRVTCKNLQDPEMKKEYMTNTKKKYKFNTATYVNHSMQIKTFKLSDNY